MRNKARFDSIQFKMLKNMAVMLILVSVVVFTFFALCYRNVYRQQAFSHLSDVETLASENVSDLIEHLDQLSVSVLADRVVQSNLAIMNKPTEEKEESDPFFRNKAAISRQVQPSVFNISGVVSLRIYSRSGEEIFVGTTNQEYLQYTLTPEQIYEANGAALWEMNGEKNYICLCRAILSTSTMEPQGYLVIVCKNAYFSNCLATIPGTYSGRTYLLNDQSEVIASGSPEAIGTRFPYAPDELRKMGQKLIQDPVSGERSYFFLAGKLSNGWSLVTTVTEEQMMRTLLLSIGMMNLVLLFVLAVAFYLTTKSAEKLAKPTQQLLRAIQSFGQGELSTRVIVNRKDEVGMIGQEYNRMADNIQTLMEQVYELELANKEAEIEFLKMQITPHFLYNTLDTISWLGYAQGSEEISDLAISLAKLLRSSIKNDSIITVERELETVQDYLNIQSTRFEDRLRVEYDVEESALDCAMPNFLLQPLIENSIIHGLEIQTRKGHLRLSIHKMSEWLYFEVRDDGRGMTEEQVEALKQECQDLRSRKSIGLKNVYRRLQLLYGPEPQFAIESAPEQGTRVSFRIPLKKEDDLDE